MNTTSAQLLINVEKKTTILTGRMPESFAVALKKTNITAIEIRKQGPRTINRDKGAFMLSSTWSNIMQGASGQRTACCPPVKSDEGGRTCQCRYRIGPKGVAVSGSHFHPERFCTLTNSVPTPEHDR